MSTIEFDLTKHISGHGPTGEIIITRPEVEVPEKVFEDFINLVDPKTNTIFDETAGVYPSALTQG